MNDKQLEDAIYCGHRWYDHTDFGKFRRSAGKKQHNIMWLVGNGFDIAVLNDLESPHRTDYQSFFYYLKSTTFNRENLLYKKMDELRTRDEQAAREEDRVPNWSDFESVLQSFENTPNVFKDRLDEDLKEIQRQFSKFLDNVVNPEVLNRLDEKALDHRWAYRTYSQFLADLDRAAFATINFPTKCDHFDVFNFNIINFNYTALLDNYLHLDRKQFNPTPHRTTDTNFQFRRNPRNYPGGGANAERGCSSYLMTEIHHPHGVQQIPRSLLFGIDGDDLSARRGSVNQLEKPFWAQTPRRYQKLIFETELFAIFGSSMGATDRWWWRHILRSIFNGSELIIYKYSDPDDVTPLNRKVVADNFISDNFDTSLCGQELTEAVRKTLLSRIFVVLYSDSSTLSGLGFCTNEFKPGDRNPNTIVPVV